MKINRSRILKHRTIDGFGKRLARIRKSRGFTQIQLGEVVGVSNRVIAYYEAENAQPPGAMLIDLAGALKVSTDELLGLKAEKETVSPKEARLLNRLRKVSELSPTDQRAVLKYIQSLSEQQQRAKRSRAMRANSKKKTAKHRASRS